MIRAMFLACGLFISLCGGLLLGVDRIVLTESATRELRECLADSPEERVPNLQTDGNWRLLTTIASEPNGNPVDVVDPPDWSAFAFLSVGCVTILYACSLPGLRAEEDDESP